MNDFSPIIKSYNKKGFYLDSVSQIIISDLPMFCLFFATVGIECKRILVLVTTDFELYQEYTATPTATLGKVSEDFPA